MIHQINNDFLAVALAEKGAELQSLINKNTGIEYMWDANPAFWSKTSPVLFPIVGGLLNNEYVYEGKTYSLGRHGFARELVFTVTQQKEDSITFTLTESAATLEKYPFRFSFSVKYTLGENKLFVSYLVKNTDDKILLFSVGGHPAFKVPLAEGTEFDDYYLKFNQVENAGIWPLSPWGQIENYTNPLLESTDILPLTKALFYKDALVFKHLASDSIRILSGKTQHGLNVTFPGFPYMGIWSFKDADFVCIEPWCGIADIVNTTGQLEDKEGINQLHPGEVFERTWHVEVF
jgi:galactose mutarotase-like enzyme